jgi:integrase
LAERFEAKVDRSGDHHLWTGSRSSGGVGQVRVDGKLTTARRVAWELANGPLPASARVRGCPDVSTCVRLDHLSVDGVTDGEAPRAKPRGRRGGGTKVKVRDGVWKLGVTVGRYDDGRPRRLHETVYVDTEAEANRELARFVAEVNSNALPESRTGRDILVDDAIEQYLTEYLQGEKGREANTIRDYRTVHRRWFAPEIGQRRVRDIEAATVDRIFGRMREAGLSTSRMVDAKSLYAPFFRWAKRRNIIRRNPMIDFDLPTSTHVAREHVPPEAAQLCLYLEVALEVVPEVAPILTLDAVTGMRRGELVTVRRSRLSPEEGKLLVDSASDGTRVKTTKTRKEREVAVDAETMAMLARHCERMDERAAACGVEIAPEAFVFSLAPDCSVPMSTHYLTKQVAKLKEHLGIENKAPKTVAREGEALRLFREAAGRRPEGRSGPAPTGAASYKEIGRRLGRSERWAQLAVASALRREAAAARPVQVKPFDGSVIALRKFTSSELLDAGFNISAVAQRQGHGPQVLIKHYAKARPSADRRAAEHLARVVYGGERGGAESSHDAGDPQAG